MQPQTREGPKVKPSLREAAQAGRIMIFSHVRGSEEVAVQSHCGAASAGVFLDRRPLAFSAAGSEFLHPGASLCCTCRVTTSLSALRLPFSRVNTVLCS